MSQEARQQLSPLEELRLEASRPIDDAADRPEKQSSIQSALAPFNRSVLGSAHRSPLLSDFSRTVLGTAYRSPLQDFAKSIRGSALQNFHSAFGAAYRSPLQDFAKSIRGSALQNFHSAFGAAYRSPLQDFTKSIRGSALQDFHSAFGAAYRSPLQDFAKSIQGSALQNLYRPALQPVVSVADVSAFAIKPLIGSVLSGDDSAVSSVARTFAEVSTLPWGRDFYTRIVDSPSIALSMRGLFDEATLERDTLSETSIDEEFAELARSLSEVGFAEENQDALDEVSSNEELLTSVAAYWNLSVSLQNPQDRLALAVLTGFTLFLLSLGGLLMNPVLVAALLTAGGIGVGGAKLTVRWSEKAAQKIQQMNQDSA